MVETKKLQGFTLLELIVAMAIIAVLIGLSLLGIQTVQRSSRDTQRRSFVDAVNLEITDYYGSRNLYPASGTVTINRTTNVVTVGTGGKTITLTGAGLPLAAAATASTSAGSVYCYTQSGNTYSFGVNLESGSWFNLGNATACTTANL